MSRTKKDYKPNKKFDLRLTEHKSGVKKLFKRASNKKIRQTPLTSFVTEMVYKEETVSLKIPKDIVKGSLPTDKTIKVQITVMTPQLIEVENVPNGLDIWTLD